MYKNTIVFELIRHETEEHEYEYEKSYNHYCQNEPNGISAVKFGSSMPKSLLKIPVNSLRFFHSLQEKIKIKIKMKNNCKSLGIMKHFWVELNSKKNRRVLYNSYKPNNPTVTMKIKPLNDTMSEEPREIASPTRMFKKKKKKLYQIKPS